LGSGDRSIGRIRKFKPTLKIKLSQYPLQGIFKEALLPNRIIECTSEKPFASLWINCDAFDES
jgi:hypothetical protein